METVRSSRVDVAYFSMEIAIHDRIPTFSGGLGVLAGDTLRACADLGLSVLGVTLVHHDGYFRQRLEAEVQQEQLAHWDPRAQGLERVDATVKLELFGRRVEVGAWRYTIESASSVPVYFLDTRLPSNDPRDQAITDRLYMGDRPARLAQEAVLGLGGPALLDAMGHNPTVFHMNEGHAALVPVALGIADTRPVAPRCVFTTHTPVPAGHDRFSAEVTFEVLGPHLARAVRDMGGVEDNGDLNMTLLAMAQSRFVNGVSRRHREVTAEMFPQFEVTSVTNGVHVPTWVSPPISQVLDRHVPGWRLEAEMLRYGAGIPIDELRSAHLEAKAALLGEVARRTGRLLDLGALTLGVARRFTGYKRNDMLIASPQRLVDLARRCGPLQVIYAGKAHPDDLGAKQMISRVIGAARGLGEKVPVVFLEDYGMSLGQLVCAGVDVWVNMPQPPHEASGTSGMKAALNGVPSLSSMDGWWIEGCIEGVTGWSFGVGGNRGGDKDDASDLLDVIESEIAPMFFGDPDGFTAVGRMAMALNGSFFSAQRMAREYAIRAWQAPAPTTALRPGSGSTP